MTAIGWTCMACRSTAPNPEMLCGHDRGCPRKHPISDATRRMEKTLGAEFVMSSHSPAPGVETVELRQLIQRALLFLETDKDAGQWRIDARAALSDTLLGFEAGAREEREAVVAWLRGQCSDPMLPEYAEFLTDYVDAIEQGQHTGGSYGQVDG